MKVYKALNWSHVKFEVYTSSRSQVIAILLRAIFWSRIPNFVRLRLRLRGHRKGPLRIFLKATYLPSIKNEFGEFSMDTPPAGAQNPQIWANFPLSPTAIVPAGAHGSTPVPLERSRVVLPNCQVSAHADQYYSFYDAPKLKKSGFLKNRFSQMGIVIRLSSTPR